MSSTPQNRSHTPNTTNSGKLDEDEAFAALLSRIRLESTMGRARFTTVGDYCTCLCHVLSNSLAAASCYCYCVPYTARDFTYRTDRMEMETWPRDPFRPAPRQSYEPLSHSLPPASRLSLLPTSLGLSSIPMQPMNAWHPPVMSRPATPVQQASTMTHMSVQMQYRSESRETYRS